MKKIHLIAAAAALLLSGGVFWKATTQKIEVLTNELLFENLTAITDPAMLTGFAVAGRRAAGPEPGTCGLVGSKERPYPLQGYDYRGPDCHISYKEIQNRQENWRRHGYSISWCCDSCKDTWYCPN